MARGGGHFCYAGGVVHEVGGLCVGGEGTCPAQTGGSPTVCVCVLSALCLCVYALEAGIELDHSQSM